MSNPDPLYDPENVKDEDEEYEEESNEIQS